MKINFYLLYSIAPMLMYSAYGIRPELQSLEQSVKKLDVKAVETSLQQLRPQLTRQDLHELHVAKAGSKIDNVQRKFYWMAMSTHYGVPISAGMLVMLGMVGLSRYLVKKKYDIKLIKSERDKNIIFFSKICFGMAIGHASIICGATTIVWLLRNRYQNNITNVNKINDLLNPLGAQ